MRGQAILISTTVAGSTTENSINYFEVDLWYFETIKADAANNYSLDLNLIGTLTAAGSGHVSPTQVKFA